MLEKAKQAFIDYTNNFDKTNRDIECKYTHSLAVCDLMGELAFRLKLSDEDIIIAKIIGLLHDIGRFEQLKETKSFDDKKFDHAIYGADYLFKDNHIRDFIDDNKYDSLIEKAIRNHNKYEIESNLNEKELLFCKMIRDMDKVDIFKQMAVKYEMEFDADKVSPGILENFKDEKLVSRDIIKTATDYTMQDLSYIFDINFNESYDILVETDNFDLYLSVVDVKENSEKLWKKIREVCFDKINRGVK